MGSTISVGLLFLCTGFFVEFSSSTLVSNPSRARKFSRVSSMECLACLFSVGRTNNTLSIISCSIAGVYMAKYCAPLYLVLFLGYVINMHTDLAVLLAPHLETWKYCGGMAMYRWLYYSVPLKGLSILFVKASTKLQRECFRCSLVGLAPSNACLHLLVVRLTEFSFHFIL